ncbi:MAG: hypothetical protein HXX18_11745 [Bacteroidetes bacterium]|nr:hypothetical protein [Bacteroidota bacterium]
MRTIFYTLIAVFIFGIIAMSFTNKANTKKSIVIQSIDSNVSSISLSQSAEIIKNRLKDFSTNEFELTIISEKNQIQVTFVKTLDLKIIENLMIQKGTLEFYETFNRKTLSELLMGDNRIFSLFNAASVIDSSTEIGCTSSIKVGKINDFINTLGHNNKCKFAWNQNTDSSEVCLYVLKTDSQKAALIAKSDIKSVKFNQAKVSKNNEIEIQLKESAIALWANATKHNINNAIAIVLDDNVIAAPIVRSEINGGRCTVTGNFTQAEAKYIAALANNGELPLSFEVLKTDKTK